MSGGQAERAEFPPDDQAPALPNSHPEAVWAAVEWMGVSANGAVGKGGVSGVQGGRGRRRRGPAGVLRSARGEDSLLGLS